MNDRRAFFSGLRGQVFDGARQAYKVKTEVEEGLSNLLASVVGEASELDAFDQDFFDSYEMSYSMTLAYPREFFEQMAEQAGIEHAGVDTLELVKALHREGKL